MQIAAKARDYGLSFSAVDLLQNPTVAQLANKVKTYEKKNNKISIGAVNSIPLTPIQQWFFEQNWENPEQWSQACLLQAKQPLSIDFLKQGIQYLVKSCDSLCLRYQYKATGREQICSQITEFPIIFKTIIANAENQGRDKFYEIGRSIQSQFNFENGSLMGVVFKVDKKNQVIEFLLIIHHLLVDGVSWRIILKNLQSIYFALLTNQSLPKISLSASFVEWSRQLQHLAVSSLLTQEKEYWLHIIEQGQALPVDFDRGDNTEHNTGLIEMRLDEEDTSALLGKMHGTYHSQINEVLLAALLRSTCAWTGQNSMMLDLESHGRQETLVDLKLTDAVGWFTSIFPIVLNLTATEWKYLLPSIKKQLSDIPNQGIGYGILRYLSPDKELQNHLKHQNSPQLCFNYWGQFAEKKTDHFQCKEVRLLSGLNNPRSHLLNLDCYIREDRFVMQWQYSQNHYLSATIQNLAHNYQQHLMEVIAHCIGHELTAEKNHANNEYFLTPLQLGLLFEHWRHRKQTIIKCKLHGN